MARRSRRGGGSAPARCKSALGTCMVSQIRGGKSMKGAARACMVKFNTCRLGGKSRRRRRGRK